MTNSRASELAGVVVPYTYTVRRTYELSHVERHIGVWRFGKRFEARFFHSFVFFLSCTGDGKRRVLFADAGSVLFVIIFTVTVDFFLVDDC